MRNIHIRVSIPSQSTSLDSIDSPSIPSSFHFYRAFYPSFTDLGSQSLEPSLIFIPCFQIQMSSNQFPSLTNTNSSISFITIINYSYYLKILLNHDRLYYKYKRVFLDFIFRANYALLRSICRTRLGIIFIEEIIF